MNYLMKKIFLLELILMTFMSCESANDNTTTDKSELNLNEVTDDSIAEPIELILEKIQGDDIPVECNYEGYMHDCWTWSDELGVNYLFRTLSEPVIDMAELPDFFDKTSQNLYIYHYRKAPDGKMGLVRELTDFEKDCEFDISAEHLEEVELTDLDQDYIGEVTFGYRLACRSDVSPSQQKVVLLEDGDKFILRGTTEVYGEGGDFVEGDGSIDANPDFLHQLIQYWDRNKVEYE